MSFTVAELKAIFTADTRGFDRGLDKMRRSGDKVTGVGKKVTTGLTAPLVAAGVAGVKSFNAFNYTMGQVKALTGATGSDVVRWQKQIIAQGASGKMGVGPNDYADALLRVTSAGVPAKNAMSVVNAAALGSKAGLGETADIADVAAVAVNAYGAQNITAARAVDILTAAVKEGKAEAEEYPPVLARILPLASTLGVRFNDVAAGVAALTRTGLTAAESGDQINAVLRTFIKPSEQSTKELKKYGLTWKGLRHELQTKGLLPTLQHIMKATDGNVASLGKLFPNELAMSGVLGLVGKQAATNVGVFKRVAKSHGEAEKAAAKMSDTVKNKLNVAWAQLQTAMLQAGAAVTPVIVGIAEWIGRLVGKFNGLSKSQQRWVVVAAAAAAALGPLLIGFGMLLNAVGTIGHAFAVGGRLVMFMTRMLGLNALATAVARSTLGTFNGVKYLEATAWIRSTAAAAAHRVALLAGAAASKVAAAATWLFNQALKGNPIVLVVSLLAMLVGAFITAYQTSDTFRRIVDKAWDGIKNAAKTVLDWITGTFVPFWTKTLPKVFSDFWDGLKDKTLDAVRWVVDKFLWFAEQIIKGAAKAFGWIPGVGPKLKSAAKDFEKFRDDVNRSLGGVRDQKVTLKMIASQNDITMARLAMQGRRHVTGLAEGGTVDGPRHPYGDKVLRYLAPGEEVISNRRGQASRWRPLLKAINSGMADGGTVGFDIDVTGTGQALRNVHSFARSVARVGHDQLVALAAAVSGAVKDLKKSLPSTLVPGGSARPVSQNAVLGMMLAAQRGWGGAQWAALNALVMSESGWRNTAQNPTSTAYGIGQFLDSTWATVGGHKTSDPRLQIIYMLRYIAQRYGDPINAWAFKASHNWYDNGGMLAPGVPVQNVHRPEAVLSPAETAAWMAQAKALVQGGGTSAVNLTFKDADGNLIGRMRGEADGRIAVYDRKVGLTVGRGLN